MSAARSDETQIDVLLSGTPEKRARYVLESLAELKVQMASIVQHCRFCDAHDDGHRDAPAGDPEQARRTWAMWGVGRWLLDRVLAVAIAATITCLITLALTGPL